MAAGGFQRQVIRDYARTPRARRRGRGRAALPVLGALVKFGLMAAVAAGVAVGAWEGYKRALRLPYFRVAEVRVEGNVQVSREEVVAALALPRGASLLELDLEALSRRVQRNPWIREASVRRQLPLSLIIQVAERVPEAVFVAGRRYLLSADGVILTELTDDELPTLPVLRAATAQRLHPGERVLTREMAQGLAVWRQFQLANALHGETTHEIAMVGGDTYVVNLGEHMPVVRLRSQELQEQLRRLGAALAASGKGLNGFTQVDLRFRDRVVFTLARGR